MKKFVVMLTLVLAIIYVAPSASAQIPGVKIKDQEITVLDTLKLKVGDILMLGQGSNPNKEFIYFYEPLTNRMGENGFTGHIIKIKYFKFYNDGMTKKYYAGVLCTNGKYALSIEDAIKSGEVIGLNKVKFAQKKPEPTIAIVNKVSTADELKKYKELLDQGVISKDEFDAQKKKLLEEK